MKLKPFTAPDGSEHPHAVWLPLFIAVDHLSQTARAVFFGFHDVGALATGKRPLTGAVKEYAITDLAEYGAMVGQPPPAGATMLDSVAAACYALAAARLDTPDASNPSGPLVSFFHGCADA